MPKRSGHANIINVLEGLQAGTASGYAFTARRINKKWTLQNDVCTQCILGKSKLPSFLRAFWEKGKEPGDYLVTNIMGSFFATETLQGEKYAKLVKYVLRLKSDVLLQLKHLLEVV